MLKKLALFLVVFIAWFCEVNAQNNPSPVNQTYQWMYRARSPIYSNGQSIQSTGYLWIPENCNKVRGLLVLARNAPENVIVGDSAVRQACAANDLGIVWFPEDVWYFGVPTSNDSLQTTFVQSMISGLAAASGYSEVASAPWCPIGESGHLIFVTGIVNSRPDRCFAGICVQDPQYPSSPQNPGYFNVPMLWADGTTYEWNQHLSDVRTAFIGGVNGRPNVDPYKNWLLSSVVESSSGHFGITKTMVNYIARYINSAAKARLYPTGGSAIKPVSLASGYLANLPIKGIPTSLLGIDAYPVGTTTAALQYRNWYFDYDLALAAQTITGKANWNAQTQLPVFTGNCTNCTITPFDLTNRGVSTMTVTTSSTFTIESVMADVIPAQFTFAGAALAKSPGNPKFEWICGAVAPVGNDGTFKVIMDRTSDVVPTCVRVYKDSTAGIRYSTQPIYVNVQKNTNGAAQTLTFNKINDVITATDSIPLVATVSSGLTVEYYVQNGPAIIRNNYLVFTKIPPKSKFPLPVVVGAYQLGVPSTFNLVSSLQTFNIVIGFPTNVSITGADSRVALSWKGTKDALYYNIYRSTVSGSNYSLLATGLTQTNYTDSEVKNGVTYYYTISAVITAGESQKTSEVSVVPLPNLPIAPNNLKASVGNGQVTLRWNTVSGANTYSVSRSTQINTGFTVIGTNITDTSFVNTGLVNETTYYYMLSASNEAGIGQNSKVIAASPLASVSNATTFKSISSGNGQIILIWFKLNGASSYNLKRSNTSGSGYSTIATNLIDTTFTDASVSNGNTYYYVVTGVNNNGESANSNELSATPQNTIPSVPTNISSNVGDGQISLSWSAIAGANGYNVKRATVSGGTYTTIAVNISGNSFVNNSGLTNGTTYYYIVSALNANGESSNSTEISASPVAIPSAPTGFVATLGNNSAILSWNTVSGANSYNVKRSAANGGLYSVIAQNVTSNVFTNTGLTLGSAWYYVVSATNNSGESANSNQGFVTILPPLPGSVTGVTTTVGNGTITLNWNTITGVNGYNIYTSTVSGGPYNLLTSTGLVQSFTDRTPFFGLTTYYVIAGFNANGDGPRSTEVGANCRIGVPTLLSVTGFGNRIVCYWTPVNGASRYYIHLSTTSGAANPSLQGIVGVASATSGSPNAQPNGILYYVTMRAHNQPLNAVSAVYSNELTVTQLPNLPSTPTSFVGIAGTNQVSLSWGTSISATGYTLSRTTNTSLGYSLLTTLTGGTLNYTDLGLQNGLTYFYRIFGTNVAGSSNATTTSVSFVPNTPTNLQGNAGNTQITLSWDALPSVSGILYRLRYGSVTGVYLTTVSGLSTTSINLSSLVNSTTYFFTIAAYNGAGESALSSEISLTPLSTEPLAPTGITITGGNTLNNLVWNTVTGANIVYNLKRATISGGPYSSITTLSGRNYTDNGLTNGTPYYYVVSAINLAGEGANSPQGVGIPLPPAPSAPSGVSLNATNNSISITYNTVTGADLYVIRISTVTGTGYTTVASLTGNNFTVTGLVNGVKYFLVVQAASLGVVSPNSSETNATPLPPYAGSVTGLIALKGDSKVNLYWNDVAFEDYFNVYATTVSGSGYVLVGSVTGATNFIHNGIKNGTTYYYVVSAVNLSGESVLSTEVNAKPMPLVPNAPSNLIANASSNSIMLNWSTVAGANYYTLKRSLTSGGLYVLVANNISGNNFLNTGLGNGIRYYYAVSATNISGESINSAEASAITAFVPNSVTGVNTNAGNTQISLDWLTVTGANYYNIKRSTTQGGGYTLVATTFGLNFVNTGLTNGTRYYFVVSASNANGEGFNSLEVNGVPAVLTNSIVEEVKLPIEIYPNPANDYLNIVNAEKSNLIIFDIVGNKILESFGLNNNQKVNISTIRNGVYILKIQSENQEMIRKLLINR